MKSSRKELIVCPTATRTTTHKSRAWKRKLASCKEVRQDDYVLALPAYFASRLPPSSGLKYVKAPRKVNLILPTETNPDPTVGSLITISWPLNGSPHKGM